MVSDDELGHTTCNVIIEDDDVMIILDLKKDEDDKNVVDVIKDEDDSLESVEFHTEDLAQD